MEGLRQSARGTTGKVIIVIAVIAFVFLGSIAVLGNLSFGSIKVNGVKVTPVELNMATNSVKSIYRQMGLSDEQASQIAIGELVNSKAFTTTINKMGVISSNELVESKIKEDGNFSDSGEFSLTKFEDTLRSNYITVEQYKGFSAEAFNKEQFQQGAFSTDFVLDSEASKMFALENQTRTFQSITIKQSDFISLVEVPTKESIQLYFDTNRTNFMTDESSIVDYISIDVANLIGEMSVSQEEIDEEYALYVEQQNAKARKTVSHILISTDERSSDEAKLLAEEAIAKIQSGEEFADVVSEYSDDIGSKDIGGFFGEISSDSVGDVDFKVGVATLRQVGDISSAVQTQFGYHVIRLDALNELEVLALADKTIEIAASIKSAKSADALKDQVEEINNARFEVDTMAQLAEIYSSNIVSGITVLRSGGDSVTSNTEFKNAAFSEQNREEGLISEAITSMDNSIILVDVTDYLPEQVKSLDEVNGEIIDILVKQKANELSIAKAAELIAMHKGSMVTDLVLVGFDESKTVSRNDAELVNVVKAQLFDMPKANDIVSVATATNGDDQVVIVLTAATNASVDQESSEFIAYKQSLESSTANASLKSFQTYVIDNADVEGL